MTCELCKSCSSLAFSSGSTDVDPPRSNRGPRLQTGLTRSKCATERKWHPLPLSQLTCSTIQQQNKANQSAGIEARVKDFQAVPTTIVLYNIYNYLIKHRRISKMSFLFGSFGSKKATAPKAKEENFDLEAEKLFTRLNLPNPTGSKAAYNPLDPIWLPIFSTFCALHFFY